MLSFFLLILDILQSLPVQWSFLDPSKRLTPRLVLCTFKNSFICLFAELIFICWTYLLSVCYLPSTRCIDSRHTPYPDSLPDSSRSLNVKGRTLSFHNTSSVTVSYWSTLLAVSFVSSFCLFLISKISSWKADNLSCNSFYLPKGLTHIKLPESITDLGAPERSQLGATNVWEPREREARLTYEIWWS